MGREQDFGLHAVRDELLDVAGLAPGHRVLDLGAGTGLIANEAAARVAADGLVCATDISMASLAESRSRLDAEVADRVMHVVADAASLPFRAGMFDVVVCRSVLIYLKHLAAVLSEIARVLCDRGSLVAWEPLNHLNAKDSGWAGADQVERHAEVRAWMVDHDGATATMQSFTIEAVKAACTTAGFPALNAIVRLHRMQLTLTAEYAAMLLHAVPNPLAISYAQAASAVLGDDAQAHLDRVAHAMAATPQPVEGAIMLLCADREPSPTGMTLANATATLRNASFSGGTWFQDAPDGWVAVLAEGAGIEVQQGGGPRGLNAVAVQHSHPGTSSLVQHVRASYWRRRRLRLSLGMELGRLDGRVQLTVTATDRTGGMVAQRTRTVELAVDGASGWMRRSTTCDIPPDAELITVRITVDGVGTASLSDASLGDVGATRP